MATQEQVTERYWTWCKGILGIPYPCRKTRVVTKWCYEFDSVHVIKWGIYCQYEGCENGTLYKWSDRYCLGIGSGYVYNVRRCFSDQKTKAGTVHHRVAAPVVRSARHGRRYQSQLSPAWRLPQATRCSAV